MRLSDIFFLLSLNLLAVVSLAKDIVTKIQKPCKTTHHRSVHLELDGHLNG